MDTSLLDFQGDMTLLGAVDLGDHMLFASDGIVMHTNNDGAAEAREVVEKAWRHPAMNVVWGFSGGASVGLMFNDWFRVQDYPSWTDLIPHAAEQLASLNGEARRIATLAEATPSPASVLAAGYLADEPRVVQFFIDGGGMSVPTGAPVFDGGGNAAALTAWHALQAAPTDPTFDPEQWFRLAVSAAVAVIPVLGEPITFLEVKP